MSNRRLIVTQNPEFVIQKDASMAGSEAYSQTALLKGSCSGKEKSHHINILEVRAAKFAILTFWNGKDNLAVHLQMSKQTALT